MAARSAEHVHFLKMPMPFAFCFAAFRLPAAIAALLLWWPFGRLPPGKRTFFAFFFLRFFFFFLAFFFLRFFFLALGFSMSLIFFFLSLSLRATVFFTSILLPAPSNTSSG